MCMMLGIDTKEPVRANELMEALYSHGNEHPNGWGLAYLPAGDGVQLTIIREAQNAAVSERVQAILREPVMTAYLIAHIRRASVGSTRLENCHPFEGKDRAGRRWVLAHNGTLFDPRKTVNYLGQRQGSTDSEAILPYLIDASNAADAQGLDEEGRLEAIDRAVAALAPGNKLNLLFAERPRRSTSATGSRCPSASSLWCATAPSSSRARWARASSSPTRPSTRA